MFCTAVHFFGGLAMRLPQQSLAEACPPNYLTRLGLWAVAPFVAMLLAIALLPAFAPRWWAHNRSRAGVAGLFGLPVLALGAQANLHVVIDTVHEYVGFITMLGSLYVIAGGVRLHHEQAATPSSNVAWLAVGAVLASILGTTGASMLLLPPFLRANRRRTQRVPMVLFFIFIVGNSGGLLSPLGDPPLFLGFMRGVPFFWTLRLFAPWALVHGVLLTLVFIIDRRYTRRESSGSVVPSPSHRHALRLEGATNVCLLGLLVAWIAGQRHLNLPRGATEMVLLALATASWCLTPAARRQANQFEWAPMQEVAILFAGIFATMPPALAVLASHAQSFGLQSAGQYFWCTGLLSAVLDNAPTYLTFTAAASSMTQTNPAHLNELIEAAAGQKLLTAISLGAVLMGALTYVGNGPNLMVRAMAQRDGIIMPSFFGYTAIAAVILVPIFCLVHLLFLVGDVL